MLIASDDTRVGPADDARQDGDDGDDLFAAVDRVLALAVQEPLGDLADGDRRIIQWADGRIQVSSVMRPVEYQARKIGGQGRQL